MWLAFTFAAIALAGSAFMVWFLIGLLRECPPSTWYWTVPAGRGPTKYRHLPVLRGIYGDEECRTPNGECSDYCVELSENEVYAKECASGLIALDVRPLSAKLGWRSIHSRRFNVFHERWF